MDFVDFSSRHQQERVKSRRKMNILNTPTGLVLRNNSQSRRPAVVDEIDKDDQEGIHGLKRSSAIFHGEVIEDSESEPEPINNGGSISSGSGDNLSNQKPTIGNAYSSDDEMLLPLSPTRPKIKRQRQLSRASSIEGGPEAKRTVPGGDDIVSSLGSSPPAFVEDSRSPLSELNEQEILTPARKELSRGQVPSSHPRFVVNKWQINTPIPGKLNYSQAPHHGEPGAYASTPRQKPRFVLPSTPEAGHGKKRAGPVTSPSPFSPLARRPRRGRGGSLAKPDFTPNGMATQVRNWILEIGARRQAGGQPSSLPAALFSSAYPITSDNDTSPSQINVQDKYCLNTKVRGVKYSTTRSARGAGHPAPYILCSYGEDKTPLAQMLLFNPPLRAPPSTVSASNIIRDGSSIGIRNGLAWEIEIDTLTTTGSEHSGKDDSDIVKKSSRPCWVGIEWDILV
ncbi:uncharacterized protein ARB_02501 [Trichophyton benhamiae CBS 112371]|uniref:Uncharacterized protein n=2 Tax=Trichophyton TaxID=5550 RepID=D4B218_ARTBC|nr:uncharacterized protein ARB_02501 [Trichophyton benhamiae CBS 112371]XP_003018643.1 uncharacterized protein TRV_07331 [Trichophyton verrucosum HKI 0517]EFE30579.1 conserved hypothetical protein [Trichophyton benhamiae CBS 112371]EFE37998.1 conserved hypothetical protein [Trichophyton verrucosum HKI 0517]